MRNAAEKTLVVAVIGLLALAGCQQREGSSDAGSQTEAPAAAGATSVFESMVQTVIPRSSRIWELAGNLYADDGSIDPRRLSQAQWQEVREGAAAIAASARALAGAGSIRAVPAGTAIQNEGTPGAPGAADVQAAIDADPEGFRSEALRLASLADEIAAAAAARDGAKVDEASARLAESCSTCHARYWYPNQGG